MSKTLQFRRGNTATVSAITAAEGEILVDTDKDTIVVGDGILAGGYALARDDKATAAFVKANNALLLSGNQTVTGGFSLTPANLNTMSNFTVNPANGNYQYGTNNGAFTLTAPASDCAVDILVTNGASAGTITLSGFTAPSGGGGDTYATTILISIY
jgi:hypothetical protein